MEHPSKEKLKKYAARELSAVEMTGIILHLENCAECFDAVQAFSGSEETDSVLLFSEAESEVFHLDYDEHLQPFVDNEADSATREIVESHTQICANCAFELRELREFSESLRFREMEKKSSTNFFSKINEFLHHISHNLTSKTVLPLIFIFIGLIAIIWFAANSSRNNIENTSIANEEKNENPAAQTQTIPNENNQTIAESFNQNIENRNSNVINPIDLTKNKLSEKSANNSSEKEISAEINNLPKSLRIAVQKTLQTKKITFPAFLSVIRQDLKFRGGSNKISTSIYPKNEAIREVSPQFRWQNFAANNEKYIVEIIDENGNSVETSQELTKTLWKPKTVLQRGKVYSWEVRTVNLTESKSFSGKFKVSEQFSDKSLPKSPLVRGIVFASQGLLTEAEREFRIAIKNGENIDLARKLLLQIRTQK